MRKLEKVDFLLGDFGAAFVGDAGVEIVV